MRINHQVVVFDAADLAAESSFWAGVLGGTVDTEDDWHMVVVEGAPRVGVQLALKAAEDADSVDNFQVYADPAGHPFCLCWVQRRERR